MIIIVPFKKTQAIYDATGPEGRVIVQDDNKLIGAIAGGYLGVPTVERPSVRNRRAAYSHDFHPDVVKSLATRVTGMEILDALPDNWRPVEGV